MNNKHLKTILFGSALVLGTLASCEKGGGEAPKRVASGPDIWDRQYITLLASYADAAGTAGNGGTVVYSVTHEEAVNDKLHINAYVNGQSLRSQRTARAQGSANGNFLYNIQYTGVNGGVFNKYRVNGGGNFTETGEEVNTEPILGTAPRWNLAAEGVGIGVYIAGASAPIDIPSAEKGEHAPYAYNRGTVKIAHINLDDPSVPNSTEFEFPFSKELKDQGYSVSRIDVPVLNAAKTKIFIGCNVGKVDPTKAPVSSTNAQGVVSWNWVNDAANRTLGTTTLVLDYPSLKNPTLIFSEKSKVNNHGYRTTTQYVGTDGHVYQATATGGSDILRIDKNTNNYDQSYRFDLKAALGETGNVRIQAWRYARDGKAVVLYDKGGNTGGFLALIDLNAGTAIKIENEFEGKTPGLSFGQYQGIAAAGDYVYVPLTPMGAGGRLYVINWKTGEKIVGAHLTGAGGSSFIGSY